MNYLEEILSGWDETIINRDDIIGNPYIKQDEIMLANEGNLLGLCEQSSNVGHDIWNNQANDFVSVEDFDNVEINRPVRSMPLYMLKNGYESMWGCVPLNINTSTIPSPTSVIIDISSDTASNFQYTNGLFSSVIPGTGDATSTIHTLTFFFSDVNAAQSYIVPMLIQFERCPIIPVWIDGLLAEGITAVAQLQCSIAITPGTPGVIIQMTVADVDISAYALLQDDLGSAGVNDVPFLPSITNSELLNWYITQFDNTNDPRFITVKDTLGNNTRKVGNIIELAKAASLRSPDILPSDTFSLFTLSQNYMDMLRGMQVIIDRIINFITNPLDEMNEFTSADAFKQSIKNDILSLVNIQVDDNLVGPPSPIVFYKFVEPTDPNGEPTSIPFYVLNELDTAVDGIWNRLAVEETALNLDQNEAIIDELRGHFLTICDIIAQYRSSLFEENSIASWYDLVFGIEESRTFFAKTVTLTLENIFKVITCSGTTSSLYQFIGSGGGQLNIEADDIGNNYMSIRHMFRNLSKNLGILNTSSSIPPSMAFSRIISHVTLLANKYHFVPDTMSVTTVPGMPQLNKVNLKFTLFDDHLIDRSRVHKYHGSNIGEDESQIEYEDEALRDNRDTRWRGFGPAFNSLFNFNAFFGRSRRNPLNEQSLRESSFYDLYEHWFKVERKTFTENVYPMVLPTWGEVLLATDSEGYPIIHLQYDDILSLFNNDIVEWGNDHEKDEVYNVVREELEKLALLCHVPPDFWCRQIFTDMYEKSILDINNKLVGLSAEGVRDVMPTQGPIVTLNQDALDEGRDIIENRNPDAIIDEARQDIHKLNEFSKVLAGSSPTFPIKDLFSVLDSVCDESRYSGKFSLIRSFPSIWISFTDHTAFGYGAHLTDMSWGYGMLKQCTISRGYDDPIDQANVQLINLFGNLDDPLFSRGGVIETFLSTGTLDYMITLDAINGGMWDTLATDMHQTATRLRVRLQNRIKESIATRFGVFPTAYESFLWWQRKASRISDTLPLSVGQRINIRMGYGQPYALNTLFNGSIATLSTGAIVNISAKGFGDELTKIFNTGPREETTAAPRRDMARMLNLPDSKWQESLMNTSNFINSNSYIDWWIKHGIPLNYPTDGLGLDLFRTDLLLVGEGLQRENNTWIDPDPIKYNTRLYTAKELFTRNSDNLEYDEVLDQVVIDTSNRAEQSNSEYLFTPSVFKSEILLNIYALNAMGDPNAIDYYNEYNKQENFLIDANDYLQQLIDKRREEAELHQDDPNWHPTGIDPLIGDIARESYQSNLGINTIEKTTYANILCTEPDFGYSKYNKSFIDFAKTCKRLAGDYIFTVLPIGDHGTIFYGKPEWPVYDKIYQLGISETLSEQEVFHDQLNNINIPIIDRSSYTIYNKSAKTTSKTSEGNILEENAIDTLQNLRPTAYYNTNGSREVGYWRRPFDQWCIHTSTDIISNTITATKDFYNGIRPSWYGSDHKEKNSPDGLLYNFLVDLGDAVQQEDGSFSLTPVQWFDADIHPVEKRVKPVLLDITNYRGIAAVDRESENATFIDMFNKPGLEALWNGIKTFGLWVTNGLIWLVNEIQYVIQDLAFVEDAVEFSLDKYRNIFEQSLVNKDASFAKLPMPEVLELRGGWPDVINGVARGHLKEEMERMYSGRLVVVGNPAVRPHCSQQLADPLQSMSGVFTAGTVIHSMSLDTGFVTEIEPKCLARTRDKTALFQIGTRCSILQNLTVSIMTTVCTEWIIRNTLANIVTQALMQKQLHYGLQKLVMAMGIRFGGGIGETSARATQLAMQRFRRLVIPRFLRSIGLYSRTLLPIGHGYTRIPTPSVLGMLLRRLGILNNVRRGAQLSNPITAVLLYMELCAMGAIEMFSSAVIESVEAQRACFIAPLSKFNRPFIAGIGGHQGSVIFKNKFFSPPSDEDKFAWGIVDAQDSIQWWQQYLIGVGGTTNAGDMEQYLQFINTEEE